MKITSIEPQKKKSNRFSIFIDGEYTFSLEDIDLVKLALKEGQEITSVDIEFYKQNYEFSKAFDKALRYVSFKRRTKSQIEKKMIELGYDENTVEKVIYKLNEFKYLDDEQYAEDYIKDRINMRPSGKRLIAMELKNKGINENIIIEKIEATEIDEYGMAYALAQKKVTRIQKLDRKELQKIYAFLMRKGFASDIIMRVLREISIS